MNKATYGTNNPTKIIKVNSDIILEILVSLISMTV